MISKAIYKNGLHVLKNPLSPFPNQMNFVSSIPWIIFLTHWVRVMHICVDKLNNHWFQIIACRVFGAKPLSEPMLIYCQLDLWNKLSWNMNLNSNFSLKMYLKMTYTKWRPFCLSLNVLNVCSCLYLCLGTPVCVCMSQVGRFHFCQLERSPTHQCLYIRIWINTWNHQSTCCVPCKAGTMAYQYPYQFPPFC